MEPNGWNDDSAAVDLVLSKLDGVRTLPGGRWQAKCPAHEDRNPSLTVARGTSQPVVFYCHAGCERDDILTALGLPLEAVSAPREDDRDTWTPRGDATAVYDYTDEDGKLLYQVCRTAGKDFPCRVPDPLAKSNWRWKLGDTRRVLYRLPAVLAAIESGEPVWITEGEKDADRVRAAGVTATCNPGGAGKWREEFSPVFDGAAVSIVADADMPGRAHARAVAASVAKFADVVEVLEPAVGKDVSDHLAAGKTLADLRVTRPADGDGRLHVVELSRFLAVTDPPQRWVLRDLMEYGDRLLLTGGEGFGKSMLVRQLAVCAAVGIHPFTGTASDPVKVLMLDCENGERKSRRKFRPLAHTAVSLGRPVPSEGFFITHRPRGMDLTKTEWRDFLCEQVTALQPGLLVIGPLYKLHGRDSNEETAARAVIDALESALECSDCALLVEAHSPKGGSQQANRRPVAPAGSRLFLAWPDLGYGLRPPNNSKRQAKVVAWRGDREERNWPRELMWGRRGEWPWVVPSEELPPPPDELPEAPIVEDPPTPIQETL